MARKCHSLGNYCCCTRFFIGKVWIFVVDLKYLSFLVYLKITKMFEITEDI